MSSDGTDAECCVSAVLVVMMRAVCQVMQKGAECCVSAVLAVMMRAVCQMMQKGAECCLQLLSRV